MTIGILGVSTKGSEASSEELELSETGSEGTQLHHRLVSLTMGFVLQATELQLKNR